jgi:hypothetical protein
MIFIDLEKIYDKILRNVMWLAFEKKKIPTKYVVIFKDMYTNIIISVRTYDGEDNAFHILTYDYINDQHWVYIFLP